LTAVNLLPSRFLDGPLREEVRTGLTATPKSLPSKWLSDFLGNAFCEKIMELPEYYLARAERAIVHAAASEIARLTAPMTAVELGTGSPGKTLVLLDALRARGGLASYFGVDISEPAVGDAARVLAGKYPELTIRTIVTDFEEHPGLPGYLMTGATLAMSLGPAFGSMVPARRAAFLSRVRTRLSAGDALLLGTALVKEPSVLVAAYDDSAGLAAARNKNLLAVLNARLGGDFDLDAFDHVVAWVPEAERVELRLRSAVRQQVRIRGADLTVSFTAGEEMRTETAARFRREKLEAELGAAGLALRGWWTDPDDSFAVSLSAPA
jgi:L-histidine Nalpha-methyltransferase